MINEAKYLSFHFILLIFVVSILILIFRPGLVSLLLGWDGLGIRSFLLVIFYRNSKALNAGILTVLTNRLGDALILIAIFLGLTNNRFILMNLRARKTSILPLGFTLLMIARITKSAQLPFRAWLPAAIAAPTPVSSLVHSSTLVTAGVYVLIRCHGVFLGVAHQYILFIGTLTMLMAGLRALFEQDIKKIVALSTLRQLGIIVMGLGIEAPNLAFFHLIAHAYFKALLFIGVGSLIHSSFSYQEIKITGRATRFMPLTRAIVIAAKLRLCGLPFFSGAFRKELILESLEVNSPVANLIYMLIILGIMLTQIYSFRFIIFTIINIKHTPVLNSIRDQDFLTAKALFTLLMPGIMGGIFFHDIFSSIFVISMISLLQKSFILLSFFLSLILALFILCHQNNLTITSIKKSVRYLWGSPLFRGQVVLQLAGEKKNSIHHSLSLIFIEKAIFNILVRKQSKLTSLIITKRVLQTAFFLLIIFILIII